jgi:hypothetical protein
MESYTRHLSVEIHLNEVSFEEIDKISYHRERASKTKAELRKNIQFSSVDYSGFVSPLFPCDRFLQK